MSEVIVIKIGGSTLGSHDTALADIAELRRRGLRPVVVHGGGPLINEWLARHNIETRFENGLRVTDERSLGVVVAVLAGLVNKEIVASLTSLGCPAVGLSGADGGLISARRLNERLGFVGEITNVEMDVLATLWSSGFVPVVAPIACLWEDGRPTSHLLNLNADTAAGAIAATSSGCRLIFLTDVPGVRSQNGEVVSRLEVTNAERLVQSGVIEGGMIPKVKACLSAAKEGCQTIIVDGRGEHALLRAIEGQLRGTAIG